MVEALVDQDPRRAMKRRLLECFGGPWDGQRVQMQGTEIRIPMREPVHFGSQDVQTPTRPMMRVGIYRLHLRFQAEGSAIPGHTYSAVANWPAYRWEGEF